MEMVDKKKAKVDVGKHTHNVKCNNKLTRCGHDFSLHVVVTGVFAQTTSTISNFLSFKAI